ncbi:hypothetical protein ZHAS_00015771 [Anopheles sinensis]|uniref:Uncharacterized protein n=1 Tax=Anopheles sinensis TaxID=74873 RepID=A0A084WC71_ANOSI|nr:hypothetical protein ZHAS_00015771 [Anopheles sinensis]
MLAELEKLKAARAAVPPNCPVPDPLVEDDEEDVHMAEMEEDEEDETSCVGSSDTETSSSDEDGSDDDQEIDKDFDAMSLVEGLRYWASTNKATEKSVNMVLSLFKKVLQDTEAITDARSVPL